MGWAWLGDWSGRSWVGQGTREERGVLEGKVKYCTVGAEHGIPGPSCLSAFRAVLLQDKSLCLCQIWPAGIGGRREANRRRCFPTTLVPPHWPFQHSKDLGFYAVTVSCGTVSCTVSCAPLFESAVAPASRVAAQLNSVLMGSSTEDIGSLGRLSTILVWGISYQLLLVTKSWKFVCSVNPVPMRLILFVHRFSPNAMHCCGWWIAKT